MHEYKDRKLAQVHGYIWRWDSGKLNRNIEEVWKSFFTVDYMANSSKDSEEKEEISFLSTSHKCVM